MYHLHRIPFLRICLAIIAGILIHEFFSIENPIVFLILEAILVSSLLVIKFLPKNKLRSHSMILFGQMVNLSLLVFGILISYYADIRKSENFYGNILNGKEQFVQLKITESPAEKNKTYKITAHLEYVKLDNDWVHTEGDILLYVEKDSSISGLLPGDRVVSLIKPECISNAGNPGEFDYQAYLKHKNIFYRAYCKSVNWNPLENEKEYSLKRIGEFVRRYLLQGLRENGMEADEFAVASAILLGADDYLDKELRAVYTGAGAMHVLCVSGLHVGILFMILNFLLKPLSKHKRLNYLRIFIILFVLWFYAVLTGLAPSVSRSALMFSLFTFGSLSGKKNISYNILAASAFVLIINNPYVIFELGFQLSYAAVGAILIFYPFISKWYCPKNRMLKFFWDGCAVSLAANIGTAPIVIFYFNQFPNYFLISNLVLLVLAPLVLMLGMIFFSVLSFPIISAVVADVLRALIVAMNYSVSFIENLPGSLSEGVGLNLISVVLWFLVIFFFSDFLVRKKVMFLRLTIGSLILISAISSYGMIKNMDNQKIIIYTLNRNLLMEFISGNKSRVITDCDDIQWKEVYQYQIKNSHINAGISEFALDTCSHYREKEFVGFVFNSSFDGRQTVIAQRLSSSLKFLKIIYYPDEFRSEEIQECRSYEVGKVIIPSHWPIWEQQKMENLCETFELPVFSLSRQGAFVLDL
ncbi:MAG: ComEC/Rec2 family competence protein [Bacteroidales bacterium]|nr:ComEC/Rec2 family competence protein [Bacteroidales bacterium]